MAGGKIPGPVGLNSMQLSGLFGSPFLQTYPAAPAPGVNRPGPLPPPLPPKVPNGFPLTRTGQNPAEMTLKFDPAESRLISRCDSIVFAQTCQIIADGKAIKPGSFTPSWKYRDAWALDDGTFLDLLATSAGPYCDDMTTSGFHRERPEGSGRMISDPATLGDAPNISNSAIMFEPAKNPKGFKTVLFKLEAFAACKQGLDQGKWYEGALWEWALTWEEFKKGDRGKAEIRSNNVRAPSQNFLAAFNKYKSVKSKP